MATRWNAFIRRLAPQVAVAVAYVCLGVALGLAQGQDLNWDLLNYHFYNPYQWLEGRLDRDVHVAGLQSYHNPVLDLPLSLAERLGVPPIVFFSTLAAFHGLALWAVHVIATRVVPPAFARIAPIVGVCAALLAATAAGYRSLIGSSMGDDTVATLVLLALMVLVDEAATGDDPRPRRLVLAGVLGGLAVGAKLATAPAAVGLGVAALAFRGTWRQRLVRMAAVGAGGVAGALVTGAWWAVLMQQHFANPFFPYFNQVFASPFATVESLADGRWLVHDARHLLFLPFYWLWDQTLVSEPVMRDGRIALLFLTLAVAAVAAILRRSNPRTTPAASPAFVLVCVFAVVTYVVWLRLFAYYRYLVPVELVAGVIVAGCLARIARHPRVFLALLLPVFFAAAVHTHAPDWGRAPWSSSYFGIDRGGLAKYANATMVMWGMPQGYLVPFFPASTTFIRHFSNGGLNGQTAFWPRIETAVNATPEGRLYVIEAQPPFLEPEQARILGYIGITMTDECETVSNLGGRFEICRAVKLPD
ncbi:MAG: hypothetical protein IT178_06500 [Acidobacteria bacterium]|nr:hypothetical protein [Acidobacteriota bacterium]